MYCKGVFGLLLIAYCSAQLAKRDHGTFDCVRACDGVARLCQYTLELETYSTMSDACFDFPFDATDLDSKPEDCVIADGVARQILVANRSIPAPQIRVCEGDTVRVNVINKLEDGMGTSVHWHGMHMNHTGFMDGVAMITQCPIAPRDQLVYEFEAKPAGTHFYHSHVGMQRGEGIAGTLVVLRKTKRFPTAVDDPSTTLVIQDWFASSAADQTNAHTGDAHSGTHKTNSLIVNGAASIEAYKNGDVSNSKRIPHRQFKVIPGESYRFRIANNAILNCPIEISIAGHTIVVIATDGADIQNQTANAVVVSGGERWDFLLNADQTPDCYWMYFRGLASCESVPEQAMAIVRYDGKTCNSMPVPYDSAYRPTPYSVVNPFTGDSKITYTEQFKLTELKPIDTVPEWINDEARRIYLDIGLNQYLLSKYHHESYSCDNPRFPTPDKTKDGLIAGCTSIAQINNISGLLPANSMYGQYDDIDQDELCNEKSLEESNDHCENNYCNCIHREVFPLHQVVELVLVDYAKYYNIANHPLHLHGQYFYVIDVHQSAGYRMTRDDAKAKVEATDLNSKSGKAIKKDTIMMPVGGYTVVRFKTDNPGPWLFHCHNELHVQLGMFMVMQVGEPNEWPPAPLSLRPCGPYKKTVPGIVDPENVNSGNLAAERYGAVWLLTIACTVFITLSSNLF